MAVEELQELSTSVMLWLSQHSLGTEFSGGVTKTSTAEDHNSHVTSLKAFASKEPVIAIL